MSDAPAPSVAIILALTEGSHPVERSLSGFVSEAADRAEVVVVDASREGAADRISSISGRVRVIRSRPGSLAPELWRDGLVSTVAEVVAFSTCQMIPRRGWLSAMKADLDASDAAGVGGPIAPGRGLSSIDGALYLLRYANYLPPVPDSAVFDPPGDNAMYRRDRLAAVESCWRDGFWEAKVHKGLRQRGETLAAAQGAIIDFVGGARLGPAAMHRLAHARHYGAERSRSRPMAARLGRSVVAPAVPPVLLARILRNLRSRGQPIGPWLQSMPELGLLLGVWSVGEAVGAVFGPGTRAA